MSDPAVTCAATRFNDNERRAIDACKRAKADLSGSEERLRLIIEAGRLLNALPRAPGQRKKTSSSGLTRLQEVVSEAGVSRQAAHAWRKAAAIDDDLVNEYVARAKQTCEEITLSGLLAWARSGEDHGDADGSNDDDDPPTHECPECGLVHVALAAVSAE